VDIERFVLHFMRYTTLSEIL